MIRNHLLNKLRGGGCSATFFWRASEGSRTTGLNVCAMIHFSVILPSLKMGFHEQGPIECALAMPSDGGLYELIKQHRT